MVDLGDGPFQQLAKTEGRDAAWTPDISGPRVAWSEWHYADLAGLRGELTWKIVSLDLRTGVETTVMSGVNKRLQAGAAAPPIVKVDGNSLAISHDDPGPG